LLQEKVLDVVVEQFKADRQLLGILLCGTYVRTFFRMD